MKKLLFILFAILIASPCYAAHWPLDVASQGVGTELVTGTDKDFSGAGNWTGATLGTFDVDTTVAGKAYMLGDGDTEYMILTGKTTVGKSYYISLKARLNAGASTTIYAGTSTNPANSANNVSLTPTGTESIFTGNFTASQTYIVIGLMGGFNGIAFEIDDVYLKEIQTQDLSGSGLTATIYGADLRNHGADFEASETDSIQFSSTTFNPQTFSLAFWAKKEASGTTYFIFGSGAVAINHVKFQASKPLVIETSTNGDYAYTSITDDTNWHSYVISSSSGTVSMYQDGVSIPMADSTITDTSITFGKLGESGEDNYFDGLLADVVIYEGRALSAAEALSYHQGDIPDGYSHYWPLSKNFADHGGSLHGTNDGTDLIGECMKLDGTDDSAQFTSTTFNPQDIGISFWAKKTATGSNLVVFGGPSNSKDFIMLDSNGRLSFETDTNLDQAYAPLTVDDTNWHHYVVNVTAGAVTMYQDGGSLTMDGTYNALTETEIILDNIGERGVTNYFSGYLTDIRILENDQFTTQQIAALYAAGPQGATPQVVRTQTRISLPLTDTAMNATQFLDISGNGNHATDNASGTSDSTGTDFDGSDDYVQVTDATTIQNIFDGGGWISCIIEPDSDGENSTGRLFDKDGAGGTGWELQLFSESGGYSRLRFVQRFTGDDGIWDTSTASIPIGSRNHIVFIYDSSSTNNDPTLYLNGSEVSLDNSTPTGAAEDDTGNDLYVGNNSAGTRTFDGHIYKFAAGKGTPSAQTVKKWYLDIKGEL